VVLRIFSSDEGADARDSLGEWKNSRGVISNLRLEISEKAKPTSAEDSKLSQAWNLVDILLEVVARQAQRSIVPLGLTIFPGFPGTPLRG
jgi:hypothetical protein